MNSFQPFRALGRLLVMSLLFAVLQDASAQEGPVFQTSFDSATEFTDHWETQGAVSLDPDAFDGSGALLLSRDKDHLHEPVDAVSPAFPLKQGTYEVSVAIKSDLDSPDNSYCGAVVLEFVDSNGQSGQRVLVIEQDGRSAWNQVDKEVDVPANIVSGRIRAEIRKASGRFWIDSLTVTKALTEAGDPDVDRIFFDTAQMGNLIYPDDPRTVKTTVWAKRKLQDRETSLSYVVKDYWGAEQSKPLIATLKQTGERDGLLVYEGTVDLAGVLLETGRYYELEATMTKKDGKPFSNHTSFAILPEAPANSYKPEDIPFTSRTWDARNPEAQYLNNRLGIRIGGVWGMWLSEPPYEASAPVIEVVEKLGMGVLTGTPVKLVERRSPKSEAYTEEVLRAGVRSFLKKYGHIKPLIINIGNEPHNRGDEIAKDIAAYRAVYTEVKKVDPSVYVVGTSVGPDEEYFKAGLGEWCDAYDFHVYGDPQQVRDILEKKYPALFEKYGFPKPIWSTELGLNSQGMERLAVAADLVKKFSVFFAAGGANASWFGIMYPDPDAKIADSFGSAHNVFDCRYSKYAPKMDALAYYNMVNGIATRKFLDERRHDDGIDSFLFRDPKGNSLQIHYRDKGYQDVWIPLPDVSEVMAIQIDGSRHVLNAGGKGISLTISEDPVLVLYKGGEDQLPEKLEDSQVRIVSLSDEIVAGLQGFVEIDLGGTGADQIKLEAPPFWSVKREAGTRFVLDASAKTLAREAVLNLKVTDEQGKLNGLLTRRPAVKGALTMNLLPVPVTGNDGPGVELVVSNHSPEKQSISWAVELRGEQQVEGGKYGKVVAPQAAFRAKSSGEVELAGDDTKRIRLPMEGVDPHTVYRVWAEVKDPFGRLLVVERPVGGFVAVPRASTIRPDGALDEKDWERASVQHVNLAAQYFILRSPGHDPTWTGPEDLSGELRFLWDENYLYVAVTVTDDIAGTPQVGNMTWFQDGLQFLVDPMRSSVQKVGKYDYAVGLGKGGPQAWCYLSADAAAPPGEVKDMKLGIAKGKKGGDIRYELAIPWSRLAPFRPEVGANLGLTMILNEDDGNTRDSFLTWFGNAHNKDIDKVGDLILTE